MVRKTKTVSIAPPLGSVVWAVLEKSPRKMVFKRFQPQACANCARTKNENRFQFHGGFFELRGI
ncbi:MAG: hypothetical protein C0507_17450 [Cyanobacteria bacterium PR.3.49]|nr:hypothetical protein [Cyanobacteria bacterium PR.3.49]